MSHCSTYLSNLMNTVFGLSESESACLHAELPGLTDNKEVIGVDPFFI